MTNVLEIDDLPEEVLQYILSFLDIESSKQAVGVCHKFYELICQLHKDKFIAVIDCEKILKDESLLVSMASSMRLFNEMRIDWNNCKYFEVGCLLNVVDKFGQNLKKLSIISYVDHQFFNPQALTSILECLPDIEDLAISGHHLTKMKTQLKTIESSLKLRHLKKLSLVNCTSEIKAILKSIEDDVLEEFNYHDYFYQSNEQFIQKFLDRQTKIRNIKVLGCENISLDHLKLTQLSVDPMQSAFPKIGHQPDLRVLKYNGKVGDTDLAALCQLKNLTDLTVDVTDVTVAGIAALRKLSSLKSLNLSILCADSTSALGVLEHLQLPNLEKLSLEVNSLITKQDVMKLRQNFPRLKHLVIFDSITFTLQEVFRSFPKIEKVTFHRMKNGWLSYGPGHKNLKEIELSHVGSCSAATWKSELEFLKKCPILEKITISEVCDFQIQDLIDLVECLPKLKLLTLAFKSFYTDRNGRAVKNEVPSNLNFFDSLIECFQKAEKLVYLDLSQLAMLPKVKNIHSTFTLTFPSAKVLITEQLNQLVLQKRIFKN